MSEILKIGRRLVPLKQIAYVETFDPESNPEFKPEKPFKARVVMRDFDNVLTELDPDEFVRSHGFSWLSGDRLALNASATFGVEIFTPSEKFTPDRPFTTRLKWRDGEGTARSKLLLTAPDDVVEVLNGKGPSTGLGRKPAQRPAKKRAARATREKHAIPE